MIKNLKKNYEKAKKHFKIKKLKYFCVTITTNTSKESNKSYLAPLRSIDDILIFGIVVYSTEQLKKICKIFDNTIDIIFVDTEKKIRKQTS